MENYKIYSGGVFKTTDTELGVSNPFDNAVFAKTYLAGKNELEESITKAKSVEREMKAMPSYQRHEILMQTAHAIMKDKERLAVVLAKEAGKPLKYALGEIDRAAQTFIVAAEESKRLPTEYMSLDWTAGGTNKEGLVKYFPLGLIAGISPFNFPLNLAVHKIAPSIAAGNCIILKPARSTPLSTLELAKILDKTSLPKGAVSILPMDRQAGNQLVTDERFKMLTFTGSPEVGWKMKNDAGKKKVVLELGGNAGVIITDSADVNKAIQKCLVGSFTYQGQVCIHVQRIYVHESLFDRFIGKLKELTMQLSAGRPEESGTDITAMIDEENAIRVHEWVCGAVDDGAEIICGGKRNGTYYEPTILTNTKKRMNVCAMEIFGPVVTVEKFSDFKAAVKDVNDSRFGLQAGVFTNSIEEMNYAFNELEVGGLMINDTPTFRVDHMPYGGVKDSGLGREGLKYAIHEMMEPRLLVKDVL